MQLKTCTKCNQKKSLVEFNKKNSGRFGVDSVCKICKSEIDKKYRLVNREAIAIRKKLYYDTNQDKIKEYRINNKTKLSKLWQQWYDKNKLQKLYYDKQYRKTPKGKAVKKTNTQNRRAAKKFNGGTHTSEDILILFDLQSGKCVYCNIELSLNKNDKFHIDHIVPLSKGGTNDINNIQLLCPHCNLSKNDKLPEEFAANFNKLL